MELTHTFSIPVPVEEAWDVLLDVERIAPCLPGATVEAGEGDTYTGKVRVKVGPITVTYRGTARITEADAEARRAVVEASGKEARGSGTAAATVTSTLTPDGDGTVVSVHTELTVTGRPAQFGRGVMSDVAGKLIDRFAECLSAQLAGTAEPPAAAPGAVVTPGPTPEPDGGAEPDGGPPPEPPAAAPAEPPGAPPREPPPGPPPEAPPLDVLDLAGGPVAQRLLPVLLALAFGVLLGWRLRGRR